MAAGYNTIANGITATSTGSYNIIGDLKNPLKKQDKALVWGYGFKGATAATYGSFNAILLDDEDARPYDGVASTVVGQANITEKSNAAIILGAGNKVTNSYLDVVLNQSSTSIFDALQEAVPKSGGKIMAIGGANNIDNAYESQVMGVGNKLQGVQGDYDEDTSTRLNYMEGFYNTAKNVQNAYIIGANNTVKNGSNNIVFGDKRTMDGQSGNIIIGSGEGDDGLPTTTTVSKAIILGNKANVTEEGGIAIGEGSIASTAAGQVGYDPSGKKDKSGNAWKATNAAVSVGNGDKLTRQITGVAAGTQDTDAVNVAQLKQVQNAIDAKKDTNTTYKLNGTTEEKNGATETTISLKDDQNKDAGSVTVRNDTLAKGQEKVLTLTDDNKLKLSIKDTAGNEAKGEVDLSKFKSAVDTNTTYTFASKANDDNTTTLTVTDSNGNTSKATVATKDTRNTLAAGDNISLKEAKQADGSTQYTVSAVANGKVDSGDKGLVSGDTVYKETRTSSDGFVTKKDNTAGENISALDRQVKSNADNINNINQSVTNLGGRVDKLGSRINKVGAGAAALAALHPQDYDPSVKWDLAAGFGNYRDASAGAIGLFYRPNPDTQFSLGTNFGNGENMVNLGVTIKLGKGSQYAGLSRAALIERLDAQTKTIDTLRAKDADRDAVIAQQQQEIEALKAAVEKLMAKE